MSHKWVSTDKRHYWKKYCEQIVVRQTGISMEWVMVQSIFGKWVTSKPDYSLLFEIYCSRLQASKIIVKLTYVGVEFETECATFRPASTGLDQVIKACRSRSKRPIPFKTPLPSKLILLSYLLRIVTLQSQLTIAVTVLNMCETHVAVHALCRGRWSETRQQSHVSTTNQWSYTKVKWFPRD